MNGTHTFYLSSYDGSNLYVNNALVVNNNGVGSTKYGAPTLREKSGDVTLGVGFHSIRIDYFSTSKGKSSQYRDYTGLGLYYAADGMGKIKVRVRVRVKVRVMLHRVSRDRSRS